MQTLELKEGYITKFHWSVEDGAANGPTHIPSGPKPLKRGHHTPDGREIPPSFWLEEFGKNRSSVASSSKDSRRSGNGPETTKNVSPGKTKQSLVSMSEPAFVIKLGSISSPDLHDEEGPH